MTDHLPTGDPLADPAITTAPLDDPAVTSLPVDAPAPQEPAAPASDPGTDPADPGLPGGERHRRDDSYISLITDAEPAEGAAKLSPEGMRDLVTPDALHSGGFGAGETLDAPGAGTEGPLDESGPPQGAGSW